MNRNLLPWEIKLLEPMKNVHRFEEFGGLEASQNYYFAACGMTIPSCFMLLTFQMSHSAVNALCRAIKLQCELYSSRQIAICLDPYCGLGFALWCLCR